MSSRLSLPCAPKATDLLSGDQNGSIASSVSGSAVTSSESSDRSHSCRRPFGDRAENSAFLAVWRDDDVVDLGETDVSRWTNGRLTR